MNNRTVPLLPLAIMILLELLGCSSESKDTPASETKETLVAWPTSNSPADVGPRDLLRRCYRALQKGNEKEYLACYDGNPIAAYSLYARGYQWIQKELLLDREIVKHYGPDGVSRFRKLVEGMVQPMDLGDSTWATQGTMKWDGSSDTAFWYRRKDVPLQDQLPRTLRRIAGHWCFDEKLDENFPGWEQQPLVAMVDRGIAKASITARAAQNGPSEFTIEQLATRYRKENR